MGGSCSLARGGMWAESAQVSPAVLLRPCRSVTSSRSPRPRVTSQEGSTVGGTSLGASDSVPPSPVPSPGACPCHSRGMKKSRSREGQGVPMAHSQQEGEHPSPAELLRRSALPPASTQSQ